MRRHRLFAEALEAILSTDERVVVSGTAKDGREAVSLADELAPDVLLMDISMPVMDGIEALEELRRNGSTAGVLMLTGSNALTDVDRARQAGAAGYVTKDRIAAELIEAIEFGERICRQLNDLQTEIIRELGRPKMEWTKPADDLELAGRISRYLDAQGDEALKAVQSEGFSGINAMARQVFGALSAETPGLDEKVVTAATEVTFGMSTPIRKKVRPRSR